MNTVYSHLKISRNPFYSLSLLSFQDDPTHLPELTSSCTLQENGDRNVNIVSTKEDSLDKSTETLPEEKVNNEWKEKDKHGSSGGSVGEQIDQTESLRSNEERLCRENLGHESEDSDRNESLDTSSDKETGQSVSWGFNVRSDCHKSYRFSQEISDQGLIPFQKEDCPNVMCIKNDLLIRMFLNCLSRRKIIQLEFLDEFYDEFDSYLKRYEFEEKGIPPAAYLSLVCTLEEPRNAKNAYIIMVAN